MWISAAICELWSPLSGLPAMEGAMGEAEQQNLRQINQRDVAELKNIVPYSCNSQLHQDLERYEHQRYAANNECVSGQGEAVFGKSNHHLLCKEEDTKVCKRQKIFNGLHTHGPLNTSFSQRRNGQERQASAFGLHIQSSSLDPRMAQHHDTVRLVRNEDYSSVCPAALSVHSSPSTLEHSESSQDYSLPNEPKCTIRNSSSTQGIRTNRVQADHNSITNRGRSIGLHTDQKSSIQENRIIGLQPIHSSGNIQRSRKNGIQADHNSNYNSEGSRLTRVQVDHNSSLIHESRVTGLYAELVKELEAQLTELRKLLASRDETIVQQDQRIKELEHENQQLKGQMRTLEEQNDLLSSQNEEATKARKARMLLDHGNGSIDVTESNIQFLKGLVGFLESNAGSQVNRRVQLPPLVPAPEPKMPPAEVRVPPFMPQAPREELNPAPAEVHETSPVGMLRVSGVTGGLQYWMHTEESSGSPAPLDESCSTWEETIQETLPDGTPAWASPVEENGRPKLELIPNSGVYITHHQLDDLSQISNEKPKLMTRRLLDYFFSRETLARSSATGQRIAHNNTTMEKPIRLPVAVVSAIKEYVTNVCGRGCNFNAVINSKCGTSRRAVKKMSIRIDWTEGSGQHCPRTEIITDGSLSPCRRATSMLQNIDSRQVSSLQMDDPTYS